MTPRTFDFEEQAGPSMPIVQEEKSASTSDDETIAAMLLNMSIPRGITIPGADQMPTQPSSPSSQAPDPKDKGKGILIESKKKKKLTLIQLKELEAAKNEEAARKMQAEWDAEELEKQAAQ